MARKKSDRLSKKNTKSTRNPSKGLGDTVEKITKATGIKKAVEWFANGKDCGCESRKEYLNKMFPYNKPECLLQDEYDFLDVYFKENKSQITVESQHRLIKIYNRVFKDNAAPTSCSSCFKNNVHNKLIQVYNQYESDKE